MLIRNLPCLAVRFLSAIARPLVMCFSALYRSIKINFRNVISLAAVVESANLFIITLV